MSFPRVYENRIEPTTLKFRCKICHRFCEHKIKLRRFAGNLYIVCKCQNEYWSPRVGQHKCKGYTVFKMTTPNIEFGFHTKMRKQMMSGFE